MRRKLTMLALLGAALTGVTASALAVPSNDGNNKDSVHGAAQILTAPGDGSVPNNRLNLTAQSGPSGESPRGKVSFKALADKPAFRGPVVCLHVEGNRATILFALEKTKEGPPRFEDGGGIVFIQDNGNPVGGAPVDLQKNRRLTQQQFANQKAQGCDVFEQPVRPIVHGNLIVRDAQP
jgi:hypothetical protein